MLIVFLQDWTPDWIFKQACCSIYNITMCMFYMQISFSDIINATENQLLRCTLNFHSCLNQQIKIELKQDKKEKII